MAYTTTQLILDKIGVTTTEISETKLGEILLDAEAEVDRIIKTTCNPKNKIKILTGNNNNYLYIHDVPFLTVQEIMINDTEIDLEDVRFNQEGKILLLNTAAQTKFYTETEPNIAVKYIYGWLEEELITETASELEAGSDVTITLSDVSDLDEGDYIKIIGTDGYSEWTKIKTIDTDTKEITVDLIYNHKAGSNLYLGNVPRIVQKLTAVIGGIMGAVFMMGDTYTFATSYSIPDYSVTKGVPYPHFVKVLDDLTKERDFLISQLPPWPVFS